MILITWKERGLSYKEIFANESEAIAWSDSVLSSERAYDVVCYHLIEVNELRAAVKDWCKQVQPLDK